MDESSDIRGVIPIAPLICPNCGERVEFCKNRYICWFCGELYPEKNVWKIRWFEDAKKMKSR